MTDSVHPQLRQILPAYRAPWWLPDGHTQTLWRKISMAPVLQRRRQRVELEDGDYIDLDWLDAADAGAGQRPLVFVLHGLCGCSSSPYVLAMQHQLYLSGYDSVAMNFRGCSGEPNRLARTYHSGSSDDVEQVLQQILPQQPHDRPLAVIGYSLGGNVILKWMAETGLRDRVSAGVAVSNPFSLAHCCELMIKGRVSRLYGRFFLRKLTRQFQHKKQWFREHGMTAQLAIMDELDDPRTLVDLWQFDDRITAPLHGFDGALDYYERCSSSRFLADIDSPTLIVHGNNDPIIPPSGLPDIRKAPRNIHWDVHADGGHVGFAASGKRTWLEERIVQYIALHQG